VYALESEPDAARLELDRLSGGDLILKVQSAEVLERDVEGLCGVVCDTAGRHCVRDVYSSVLVYGLESCGVCACVRALR
jgi:hypothetical protein